ncbi:ABC transporter related protein [Paenibacillus curdlanolyticus YK9]|uniref:ABC transporter related protein n=1 Tax=Paenibacillus curdlanolyticus YK9 TaxID=717606 RepID=E0I6B7_9BACL|nr:ABC transporter ATP-binding protein [Paenibacillus curdlanolyticus]EFM11583.1 ABC transporter related protein [Paenibacillus curdlanolyticus YK9]
MLPVLQLESLVGGYSPRRPVLHGLTFNVKPGEIVGLIGLNGAGKSTAIKHILGLMAPHSGSVRVSGATLEEQPELYRGSVAYVPESPVLFDELTVDEHLRLTGMAYGVEGDAFAERRERLLDEFHMRAKRGAFAEHLSKGMKQKVMIMNALLANPPLYIIDEPFLGLDPLGIRSLLDRLVEVKKAGAAVLMSSHILSTVEAYCDRYIVLHHGRIAAMGALDDVLQAADMRGGTLDDAFFKLVSSTAGGGGASDGR